MRAAGGAATTTWWRTAGAQLPASAIAMPLAMALRPAALRFDRALRDPRRAQERAWHRMLPALAMSRRGRRLGLRSGMTLDDLRRDVPLSTYDALATDLQDAADGTPGVLTSSPIVRFERSGGSTGAHKLLPFTQPFLGELSRALLPWLADLYAQRGVARGASYWSISPVGMHHPPTRGGIPVGTDDDTSWFPAALQPVLARVLASPAWLAQLSDVEVCRDVTMHLLCARDDLALLSVWSPSFFTLLWRHFEAHRARIVDDVAQGRCRPPTATAADAACLAHQLPLHLPAVSPSRVHLLRTARTAHELWPRLALVSTWTEGSAAGFVDEMQACAGDVPLQGKGLLATEGTITIPLGVGSARVAPMCVDSHVIELLDEETGACVFADEAQPGRTYEVVLTTGAGLVRHRLFDRVEVTGLVHRTPSLRFLGRAQVCDLVGEKLAAARVEATLPALLPDDTRFALLAPVLHARPAHYRLYVDTDAPDDALQACARAFEARCAEGHPWAYARALGQLGPIDVVRVRDGARALEARGRSRGQRAGDIKPMLLSTLPDWDPFFALPSSTSSSLPSPMSSSHGGARAPSAEVT